MSENTAIEKKHEPLVPAFDITQKELPNLHGEEIFVVPFDLQSQYWSPEEGEVKRGFIQPMEVHKFPHREDPQREVDVECVKLWEHKADGTTLHVINGSKRLVQVIKNYMSTGQIQPGTPLEISFLGEQKNKTNANKSHNWSVKPLTLKK